MQIYDGDDVYQWNDKPDNSAGVVRVALYVFCIAVVLMAFLAGLLIGLSVA